MNVYSEISNHIDQGNVVQKHILTHLYQYFERDVDLIDGVPYYRVRRSWYHSRIEGRHQWHVCPKTGILKRAPKRAVHAEAAAINEETYPAWAKITCSRHAGPYLP